MIKIETSEAAKRAIPSELIPENDNLRLEKLYQLEVLDTAPEFVFDKIARLASQIFKTPSAFVTFVDKERVFFKSSFGSVPASEVRREESLCSIAILSDKVTVFNDTHQVPSLAEHPFVIATGGIRFYAGAPLKTKEGFIVGTLCVIDVKPNQASAEQLDMLQTLSSVIVDELELRRAAKKALSVQSDLINSVVHDLKNPLASISLGAELVKEDPRDLQMVQSLAKTIIRNVHNMESRINNLLDLSRIENGALRMQFEKLDIWEIVEFAADTLRLQALKKKQRITLNKFNTFVIKGDKKSMIEVFENIFGNAVKYSEPGSEIVISAAFDKDKITIECRDQGQGLDQHDLEKIFSKFAKLSSIPTSAESSHGLGLFIVKTLVELNRGNVWVESKGKDRGSSFFVSLPV